jgi:glyoxylase-like metal-dependent hydrolase (beta-lactamase superfamily II)
VKAPAAVFTLALSAALLLPGCSASTVDTRPAQLGRQATYEEMLAAMNTPGPIVFEKHLAADWAVPLSGLLNLDHPKAIAAGLQDREEPIQIYVYSLRHPQYGNFIVDSGMAESFLDASNNDDVSAIVKMAMNIPLLDVQLTTSELQRRLGGIDGVFLTHIHMDHIMGLGDLDAGVPVYSGPGDAALTSATHIATRGTTDRLLASVETLREWQFDSAGVVDIFGDGSLWAIHSPGHTPGSTAYLALTSSGPQLMIGDATHTSWGWENGVEPGSYSDNGPQSAISLARLQQLSRDNPAIHVHPGHQAL